MMRRLLMCPPDFYEVRYEINPWMSVLRTVNRSAAKEQWQCLKDTLQRDIQVEIQLVNPRPRLPDMVFTANAGLVYQRTVAPSRFYYEERAAEEPYFRSWFEAEGFTITDLEKPIRFEGEGDALFFAGQLVCGYGFRSDREAAGQLAKVMNVRTIAVELVDPYFYHLDTCFCPLSDTTALIYPPAISRPCLDLLERIVPNLIPVCEHDARRFACNAVVVGRDVVMNSGCDETRAALLGQGYRPHEVDLSEFMKAGGSAKCLVMFLDNGPV